MPWIDIRAECVVAADAALDGLCRPGGTSGDVRATVGRRGSLVNAVLEVLVDELTQRIELTQRTARSPAQRRRSRMGAGRSGSARLNSSKIRS
jgi:hypothetical protein